MRSRLSEGDTVCAYGAPVSGKRLQYRDPCVRPDALQGSDRGEDRSDADHKDANFCRNRLGLGE
jgi:hypothetical protein